MKNYLNKKIPISEFTKNVFILFTGTTLAQIISTLASPFLSRIYNPYDYGVLASYGAIVSLFAIISTGRYELAVMLPEEDKDALNIMMLSLIIATVISLLVFFGIFIIDNFKIKGLIDNNLSFWLYMIPVSIFLTGLYQTLNYWFNRKKQYKVLAFSRVFQSILVTILNLILGFCGFGVSGLIASNLFGQLVSTIVLTIQFWIKNKDKRKLISKESIKNNAKKYQDFPKINSLHAFIDMVQASGVIFLISSLFGLTVLGFYSFSIKVMKVPLSLLSSAISDVFYQKASEAYFKKDDLENLVKNTLKKVGLFSLPLFIIFLLFSPNIFAIVFGEKWRDAGVYTQILSPWIFINNLASSVSPISVIVNKQKSALLLGTFGNLLVLLSIFYGNYVTHDIKYSFCLLSFSMIIYHIYGFIWVIKISKNKI